MFICSLADSQPSYALRSVRKSLKVVFTELTLLPWAIRPLTATTTHTAPSAVRPIARPNRRPRTPSRLTARRSHDRAPARADALSPERAPTFLVAADAAVLDATRWLINSVIDRSRP